MQTVAPAIEPWLETPQDAEPVPLMYISADGTGVPMRKEELQGRRANKPTPRLTRLPLFGVGDDALN